jgi:hypothetical protein
MSANDDAQKGTAYSPARVSKFTLQDFQQFKQMLEESPLKWWIIAAGIGGALEGLHVLWLFILFLLRAMVRQG